MTTDEQKKYIIILENCDKLNESFSVLQQYVSKLNKSEFMDSVLIQDAVLMRLAVIGEITHALKKNIPDLEQKYSDIEWENIYRLRNIIVHDYYSVDREIIWNSLQEGIPPLIPAIQKIKIDVEAFLSEMEDEDNCPRP